MNNEPLNKLHYFEVGDRCHIINVNIETALFDHPALTPEMTKHLEDAQAHISEVYQWSAQMYEVFDENRN